MPSFGKKSQERLNTCDPRLVELFEEVVEHFDCTVIQGYRDEVEQNKAFEDGFSKLKYPQGSHNKYPSLAVDIAPYPIDWKDRDRFHLFAGFVKGIASQMGLNIRWGGDWNSDTHTKDNNFDDLPHFEVRG
ncbi:MAG: M15 family peptidase [Flavobacteriales bacterium]|jgi:peptidoglycan LD-endopeptidase CwlK|nr:M15 family peptidase [Flavobacteriales bacterium]